MEIFLFIYIMYLFHFYGNIIMHEEMFLVGIYLMDFYFIFYNYYLDLLDPSNVCFYFLPIKSTFCLIWWKRRYSICGK
ncbi:hypothetical protein VIGAN_01286600 [Vigna angularis var. angularis]|uniref:Uncharacterized protein n=1 Tax=Vigna angularis var. angularis TaxID=157739 RepID=A0A0S3R3B8_PHAAN|nr:hypothetical protein VIGAN_01286600 [Vigna angularis var. angularis]